MAYYSGSVSSFSALKTAIETACVTEGWTLSDDILSLDGCYVQLTNDTSSTDELYIDCGNSQTGSTLNSSITYPPKIYQTSSTSGAQLTFPVDYEIHIFSDPVEIYCVINFDTDAYLQLSFGQSNLADLLTGSGNWVSASNGNSVSTSTAYSLAGYSSTSYLGAYANSGTRGFPFFDVLGTNPSYCSNKIYYSSKWLTSSNYSAQSSATTSYFCTSSLTQALIMYYQPNTFNSKALLFPVDIYAFTGYNSIQKIATLQNLRFVNITNLSPGDIITLGSDQWIIYPHLRRNASYSSLSTSGYYHSAVFGAAIRYTGT